MFANFEIKHKSKTNVGVIRNVVSDLRFYFVRISLA